MNARTRIAIALLVALVPLSLPATASAFDFEEEETKVFEAHLDASELFVWRNDGDFDPTIPYYEEEGQSVGGITSFVKPMLTWRPLTDIELYYEAELGLNQYSRNNPDQWFPGADDYVAYKHREFYTKFQLDLVSLKVGYQRVRDPSDLFLSHWFGAARVDLDLMRFRAGLLVGQLPDSTFEGLALQDNNFVHDNVLTGITFSYDVLMDQLTVDAGSYFLYDSRVPRKELFLAVPYLAAHYRTDGFCARAVGLLQVGSWESSGVAGIDQNILAWAVTAKAKVKTEFVDFALHTFALSGDDRHPGNSRQGAFFYSGKNGSSTLLLTEDEIRDRYDNFDESLGGTWGSFFLNRAGLSVTDLSVTGKVGDWFFPQLIVGFGATVNPDNAAGHSYVGFEADLVLRVRFLERVEALVAGQLFLPGAAAAAFVNEYDMQATEQMHGLQVGTVLTF